MAVVEVPFEEFRKRVKLSKEKLVDALNELGAPAEEGENDLIVCEITPNRPDWFFVDGLARSVNSYIGEGSPEYRVKKGQYSVIIDKSVEKIRPYSACAVVRGVNIAPGMIQQLVQFQEKLIGTLGRRVKKFGMGFFDLEKIEFPVRYTTKKPKEIIYKPLNYPKTANAEEILQKHPKGIENGYLLDGFDRYPVYLDAADKVLVFIPIVNSQEAGEITEQTKDLFIEVTGNDFNTINSVLSIVCCALADLGGEVCTVEMQYPDRKITLPELGERRMKLELGSVNKILGLKLTAKELKGLLARMGFEFNGKEVVVPPYRVDVIHEIDVIEDVAIAYGYNKFEPSLPGFFSPGKILGKYKKIEDALNGMGFREVKTFLLTDRKSAERFGYPEADQVLNPASEEYTTLKPTGIISILEVFRTNKTRGLPQKLYEIGDVYYRGKLDTTIVFGIMDRKVEFSDLQTYLQSLAGENGIKLDLKAGSGKEYLTSESARVFIGQNEAGVIGKVSKKYFEEFEVAVCELNLGFI